jgi:hypothetical protein
LYEILTDPNGFELSREHPFRVHHNNGNDHGGHWTLVDSQHRLSRVIHGGEQLLNDHERDLYRWLCHQSEPHLPERDELEEMPQVFKQDHLSLPISTSTAGILMAEELGDEDEDEDAEAVAVAAVAVAPAAAAVAVVSATAAVITVNLPTLRGRAQLEQSANARRLQGHSDEYKRWPVEVHFEKPPLADDYAELATTSTEQLMLPAPTQRQQPIRKRSAKARPLSEWELGVQAAFNATLANTDHSNVMKVLTIHQDVGIPRTITILHCPFEVADRLLALKEKVSQAELAKRLDLSRSSRPTDYFLDPSGAIQDNTIDCEALQEAMVLITPVERPPVPQRPPSHASATPIDEVHAATPQPATPATTTIGIRRMGMSRAQHELTRVTCSSGSSDMDADDNDNDEVSPDEEDAASVTFGMEPTGSQMDADEEEADTQPLTGSSTLHTAEEEAFALIAPIETGIPEPDLEDAMREDDTTSTSASPHATIPTSNSSTAQLSHPLRAPNALIVTARTPA